MSQSRFCVGCGTPLSGSRHCVSCGRSTTPATVVEEPPLISAPTRRSSGGKALLLILVSVLALGAAVLLFRGTGEPSSGVDPGPLIVPPLTVTLDASPPSTTPPEDLPLSPSPAVDEPPPASPSAPATAAAPVTPEAGPLAPVSVSASCIGDAGVDSARRPVDIGPLQAVDGRWDTAWRCTYRERSGDVDSSWVPDRARGINEWITVDFGAPVTVTELRLLGGYPKIDPSNGDDRYRENGRPVRVSWSFDDDPARTIQQECLPVRPAFSGDATTLWCTLPIAPTTATTVTMQITGIDPAKRDDLAGSVAVSEILLLGQAADRA